MANGAWYCMSEDMYEWHLSVVRGIALDSRLYGYQCDLFSVDPSIDVSSL